MDLSKLSDADLMALKAGDITKVSDAGLHAIKVAHQLDADRKAYDPTNGMSTTDKVLAGIGQGMSSAGRGVGQLLGMVSDQDVKDAKQTDAALLNTTAGKVGSVGGTAAAVAPTMFIPGANTLVGAGLVGAGTGALTTEGGAGDRLKGAALGAAGGLVGKVGGDALGAGVNKLSQLRADRIFDSAAANAGKAQAATAARDAGYAVPVGETNPSAVNSLLEAIAGPAKTAKAMSAKNQTVTNKLAADAVGIEGTITPDKIAQVRADANKAYAAVKGTGTVTADDAYRSALDGIAQKYAGASKDFPQAVKPEVANLVDSLRSSQFGADSAVDMIGTLRANANDAFAAGSKQLAKANRAAADALEAQLSRHLEVTGQPTGLVKDFQEARTLLAKVHDVDRATNSATGDVSASFFAKQLEKNRPLTDQLRSIGEANAAFPKATQTLKESPKALGPLDVAYAMAGGIGHTLTAGARPIVRNALTSDLYQRLMATPGGRNSLMQLMHSGANSEIVNRLAPTLGIAEALPANK